MQSCKHQEHYGSVYGTISVSILNYGDIANKKDTKKENYKTIQTKQEKKEHF